MNCTVFKPHVWTVSKERLSSKIILLKEIVHFVAYNRKEHRNFVLLLLIQFKKINYTMNLLLTDFTLFKTIKYFHFHNSRSGTIKNNWASTMSLRRQLSISTS